MSALLGVAGRARELAAAVMVAARKRPTTTARGYELEAVLAALLEDVERIASCTHAIAGQLSPSDWCVRCGRRLFGGSHDAMEPLGVEDLRRNLHALGSLLGVNPKGWLRTPEAPSVDAGERDIGALEVDEPAKAPEDGEVRTRDPASWPTWLGEAYVLDAVEHAQHGPIVVVQCRACLRTENEPYDWQCGEVLSGAALTTLREHAEGHAAHTAGARDLVVLEQYRRERKVGAP